MTTNYRKLIENAPMPADLRGPWEAREIARTRAAMLNETTERGGAIYWNSNGAPVPVCVFTDDARVECPAAQRAACKKHNDEFLAEYRRTPPRYSDEALAEIMHEIGPNAVDVITGRRVFP